MEHAAPALHETEQDSPLHASWHSVPSPSQLTEHEPPVHVTSQLEPPRQSTLPLSVTVAVHVDASPHSMLALSSAVTVHVERVHSASRLPSAVISHIASVQSAELL